MEKYYPPAVHRKAEKLEQLLLRLEQGEELTKVCAELALKVSPERVEKLRAKYEAGGRQRAALLDGRYGHYQHVNSAIRAYLYERKRSDEGLTAGQLAQEVAQKYEVVISEGHINHVLRELALTRPPGRPRKQPQPENRAPVEPAQANAGLFFPGGGEASPGGNPND